jgi:AcrR family transcriptional regulator
VTRPPQVGHAGRTGRRAGHSGTREQILAAARRQFAERGYDRATIRAIAARAGVDPALVHHFYGTKERLFVAAMRVPVVPSEMLTAALAAGLGPAGRAERGNPAGQEAPAGPGRPGGTGEVMIRLAVGIWDSPEVRSPFLGLLRSAMTSEQAARMLREFVTENILGPVARAAGVTGPEAQLRMAMVASQVIGLAMARYVLRLPPVAEASADRLAALAGPNLDRYLTGDLRPGTA